VAKLPPAPTKLGVTTESVRKTTYTETVVKRVTNNQAKPKIEDVTLVKAGGPLGLSIIGGSDHSCVPFGTGEPGIFISKIIPGGAAARTGRLRMGDRILSVNGVDIRGASHQDAVMALLVKADQMKITVQHDPLPAGFKEVKIEKSGDDKLGMVVKGGIQGQPGNPHDPTDEGVFISKINDGGCASANPELSVGQRIIEVNGQSLLGATHAEAVGALRNAGNSIQLLVCDGWNSDKSIEDKSSKAEHVPESDVQPEPEVHPEQELERPKSAQEKILDAVKAAEEVLRPKSPRTEPLISGSRESINQQEKRTTMITMSGHPSGIAPPTAAVG
jgi:protein scribble